METLSDIEKQIAELLAKKEELLQLQNTKLQAEEEAYAEDNKRNMLKLASTTECKFTITKYQVHQLKVTCTTYRHDYWEGLVLAVPSLQKLDYNVQVINIKDYNRWLAHVNQLPNITINNLETDYIEYYLNGPQADIKLGAKDATVKIHPLVSPYNIFDEMTNYIAKINYTDGLWHLPKNELYKLLKKTANNDKIVWDKAALAYATKDLEGRTLLDSIALLESAPEYDIDLNGHRLKPFQQVGVMFAVTTKKTIGDGKIRVIIADEMGLGKTWQAIAIAVVGTKDKVACIVPAYVKENWKREIFKLTGEHALVLKGTQPSIEDMKDIMLHKGRFFIFNYDMLSRPIIEGEEEDETQRHLWIETINSLGFKTIILDEAHKCKNADSGRTKAIIKSNVDNYVELTGTPVLNRPAELFTGLHLLNRDVFNNREGFENRYSDGRNGVRNVEELRDLLRPYMIRRLKRDVAKDLPPIIRTTQHVEMTEKQRSTYSKMLMSIIVAMNEKGEDEGEELGVINHILVKILRLKQFLSKIKAQQVAEFAKELYDQADPTDPYKKVIVFSQFIPVVLRISKLLNGKSLQITGVDSPYERQLIVDEFQTNPNKYYLVATPQSASEGLNITAAGHVVFCDYMWTPAVHQQSEGRAYGRLNDSHTIESHYFAVLNSLDDWLRDILLQKIETIEAVVDGVNQARTQDESIVKELMKALRRGELR